MSAQDATLSMYHHLMQINAASHLIRAARELGVFQQLSQGQQTQQQLCEALSLQSQPAGLLLDGLVATGIVERYEDDFALSQAAQLLCQYDEDLGDQRWQRLADRVRKGADRAEHQDQRRMDHTAATQWVHTPAAIEAAEMLDIGGAGEPSGVRIVDLGCGSAVWSCAMAHRDPQATVTAVDNPAALQAAGSTAESIGLSDRFATVEADDPAEASVPDAEFDLALLAQRLGCLADEDAAKLLAKAIACVKPGGRVVVIDLFRGPTKPKMSECVEALKLYLDTRGGYTRSLDQIQDQMQNMGLQQVQFAFLPVSKVNLGMAVGWVSDES